MAPATFDELQSLYIAYFGRPADPAGLIYWESQGISEKEFAAIQFAQPEFQSVNSGLSVQNQVNNLYLNLFGRNADVAGLTYWVNKINTGEIQLAEVGVFLVKGALGEDKTTIDAKIAAANQYTRDVLASSEAQLAYNPTSFMPWVTGPALTDGKTFLAGVDTNNIPTDAEIAAAVAAMAAGGTPGQTENLTPQLDTILITTVGTNDIVNGIVTGPGLVGYSLSGSTWTPGDSIDGNGFTTVNFTITGPLAGGDYAAFGTIKDVSNINLTQAAPTDINFEAVTWENIGSINLQVSSGNGVFFNNLQTGTDLLIGNNAEGSLSASYTDDIFVFLGADRRATLSYVDGVITAAATAGDSVYASVSSTADNTPILLGDVTMAGVDASRASLYVSTTGDNSAITVGNISVDGFSDIRVSLESDGSDSAITVGNVSLVAATSIDFTVSASGDDSAITVGDISVETTAVSADISVTITNSADKGADITVGDIAVVMNDDSDGYVYVYGYTRTADSATTNSTVGNVTLVNGDTDAGYISFSDYNRAQGGSSLGETTVGNISLTVAEDVEVGTGDEYFIGIYNQAVATGTTDLGYDFSSGNITVGDVSLVIGTAAEGSVYISQSVRNSAGTSRTGTATIGNTTVGDISVLLAENAEFTGTITQDARGDFESTLVVGDIVVGNVNIDTDSFGSAYLYINNEARDAESATVGNVTVGDVTYNAGPSAYMSFTIDNRNEYGSVGDITIGNVIFTAETNATIYSSISNSGETTVGNITVGDVTLLATGTSSDITFSIYNTNDGADATDVTGNISIGNIALTANDFNAYAYMYVTSENDGSGDVGTITLGNVALTAAGTGAFAGIYVSASSADTTGVITVGDIAMDVTGAANQVYFQVYNEDNDVVVGNITVVAGTDVTAATNGGFAYVTLTSASGDVTIGDVTVSGGDWTNDNLSNLFGWLSPSYTGTLTIGNIDYSGYAPGGPAASAVTLDLSPTTGAATIIGSGLYDTITDNSGTNALTGGAGFDNFQFINTNNHLTEATADTITDWNFTQDLIGFQSADAVNYASAAGGVNYATFLANAEASTANIFVQARLGGGVFVAFDFQDASNTVDSTLLITNANTVGQVTAGSFYNF